jgi:hypothetical protein
MVETLLTFEFNNNPPSKTILNCMYIEQHDTLITGSVVVVIVW